MKLIKSITHIKNFGVYRDFEWPTDLASFKRFNIFYGWNYSGKTTLSRLFRCAEQGRAHPDFAKGSFRVELEGGAVEGFSGWSNIRVFNREFVSENLSFNQGDAAPVLILGALDIAKQASLEEKRGQLQTCLDEAKNKRTEVTRTKKRLEGALANSARDLIKNQLQVPEYDRPKFEEKVSRCSSSPRQFTLEEDQLNSTLLQYRSTEKKPTLQMRQISLQVHHELISLASKLMEKVVDAEIIDRLKHNRDLETWVNQGCQLHQSLNDCQFCGAKLAPELLKQLARHFSEEYALMSEEITRISHQIAESIEEIQFDDDARIYDELRKDYIDARQAVASSWSMQTAAMRGIMTALEEKRSRMFESTTLTLPSLVTAKLAEEINVLNAVIKRHNDKTQAFEARRTEAFRNLEQHFAAQFAIDQRYHETKASTDRLEKEAAAAEESGRVLAKEVAALEREVSEAAKGAEQLNDLLKSYFRSDDLKIVVSAEGRFKLMRRGHPAKHLSDGERTAIAFSYFITTTSDGKVPIDKLTVFIDDPVSSLDANHTFNTYAMIKVKFGNARQLFITTHSFEFYNLVREWMADEEKGGLMRKPMTEWKNWSAYLIRKVDTQNSTLSALPSELLRFKSEYHYLFSILAAFQASKDADFSALLALPNVVRRYMEAFGGIMIPTCQGLHPKMDRIFPDEMERERVWKFINHYSHNTSISRSLIIPDTSECLSVVESCLNAIKRWNAVYFNELCEEVA